ncbi:sulfate transporter family-domain-containing protein [Tricladium varicosporioides]|nr:sulfate transporter family-domain-containing protein [Hymenoscyphus varicosporioides]
MTSNKPLQFVKKRVLHIDPDERYSRQPKDLEKRAKDAVTQTYIEEEPNIREWAQQLIPTRDGFANYMRSLFPSATWIGRYNLHWLMGDTIAGLTIGFVVVPQAMAYALLARLSPEYGLYTSFVGAALYWLFGTSKDIVIGTTAVGSLLVGRVISKVDEARPGIYSHEEIAKSLSVIAGSILLGLGLLRLGWIIEFIPYVPISAFVTAASITIMSTQLPVALGIKGINTREAPYLVILNTLKALGKTRLDATIGLTSIALLFFIRSLCAGMEVRQPHRKRLWVTVASLRLTFTILLYTFISWLVHRNLSETEVKFRIVGKIQAGFKHAGFPKIQGDLLGLIFPELPAIVIILIIEHIAIAKSFGRQFNYTVNPSQEILAQGAANFFGPFVGGYVCTGSFGASAVLSKAGVRTPLAGLVSALILVLALYALTAVFYYIPMAALAGLIIHATANLITPPRSLYKYWQLSPFELFIWIAGVVLALFISLETSIYATIGLSFALLLVRLARTKGRFLGRVHVYRVTAGNVQDENANAAATSSPMHNESNDLDSNVTSVGVPSRDTFLPLDRDDSTNPDISVESPYPGVFIFRFSEGFNYINQAQHMDHLLSFILAHTCRTKTDDGMKARDRLWNDPGPAKGNAEEIVKLPHLRAIVLDCSAVNNVDITSVQGLIDLRNTLDRYTTPSTVEWHFAGVQNRWTRRALAVAGFGYPAADKPEELGHWTPAYTVASSLAGATDDDQRRAAIATMASEVNDEEKHAGSENSSDAGNVEGEAGNGQSSGEMRKKGHGRDGAKSRLAPVTGVDRPFFHIDLVDAVDAAIRDSRKKDGCEVVS